MVITSDLKKRRWYVTFFHRLLILTNFDVTRFFLYKILFEAEIKTVEIKSDVSAIWKIVVLKLQRQIHENRCLNLTNKQQKDFPIK